QVREPAQENLRRQVAPMLMAERTLGSDGLRRHRLHGRRDILAATLAVNHHAFRAFWSLKHELQYRRIKGETDPQVQESGSIGPWSISEHRGGGYCSCYSPSATIGGLAL